MSAAKLVIGLAIVVVLLPGLVWAASPVASRLDGRLPDSAPVVSIDQPRGTVLDALSALSKQAGWSLVVTAPESATSRPLTIQVSRRPAADVLEMVLDAGGLRAAFADGVLRVRSDAGTTESRDFRRGRRRDASCGPGCVERRGRHGSERVVFGQSLNISAEEN